MESTVRAHFYIVIDDINGMTLFYNQSSHEWTPRRTKGTAWMGSSAAKACLEQDSEVNKFLTARIAKVRTTIEEVAWIGEG